MDGSGPVTDAYIKRMTERVNTIKDLLIHMEDFPVSIPPKPVSVTPPPDNERCISPHSSFAIQFSPQLLDQAWDSLCDQQAGKLQVPLGSSSTFWLSNGIYRHKYMVSWSRLTMYNFALHEASVPFHLSNQDILAYLGIPAVFGDATMYELPMRSTHPGSHASSPDFFAASLDHIPRDRPSDPLESPYFLRALYVNNIDNAGEICQLASRNITVQKQRGKAVWPDTIAGLLQADPRSRNKYLIAQDLLIWVYNAGIESNVEFVKLSDGWTHIYFQVSLGCLRVCTPLTPRYPYPGFDEVPRPCPLSLNQAYIAIVHKAWTSKKQNRNGTRLYASSWQPSNNRFGPYVEHNGRRTGTRPEGDPQSSRPGRLRQLGRICYPR